VNKVQINVLNKHLTKMCLEIFIRIKINFRRNDFPSGPTSRKGYSEVLATIAAADTALHDDEVAAGGDNAGHHGRADHDDNVVAAAAYDDHAESVGVSGSSAG
jgi:hypothetical protein